MGRRERTAGAGRAGGEDMSHRCKVVCRRDYHCLGKASAHAVKQFKSLATIFVQRQVSSLGRKRTDASYAQLYVTKLYFFPSPSF